MEYKYRARDKSGIVFQYTHKPHPNKEYGIWAMDEGIASYLLHGKKDDEIEWTDSLEEINCQQE